MYLKNGLDQMYEVTNHGLLHVDLSILSGFILISCHVSSSDSFDLLLPEGNNRLLVKPKTMDKKTQEVKGKMKEFNWWAVLSSDLSKTYC